MHDQSFHASRAPSPRSLQPDNGRRPRSWRRRPKTTPRGATVAAFADEWFELAGGRLRERTLANYRAQMRIHVLPRVGSRAISDLSEDDLVRMIRELQASGYAAWTIRTVLTPLSRMLNHAMRRGLITSNPVAGLERSERPAVWEREQRILSRDEIGRLLACAPPQYRTLLATAIFTGVRQGELLALTWCDIDLDGGVVKVRKALDRKGRRVELKTRNALRDVVLMPALAARLQTLRAQSAYRSPHDYVFASRVGTPLYWRNLSPRALHPALAKANLEPLRWHDLRHTFAALLIMQGANIAYVSRQMGHGSAEITLRVYSHVFDQAEYAQRIRGSLETSFRSII